MHSLGLVVSENRVHPNFEGDGRACVAALHHASVAANDVSHLDWLVEDDLIDSDSHCSAEAHLFGENATCQVHLAHDPSTKNVPVGVGVGWHGYRSEKELIFGKRNAHRCVPNSADGILLCASDVLLVTLFVTCFLAATLLPGGSEAALVVALLHDWGTPIELLVVASLGNTLGGLLTVGMGWAATRLATPTALARSPWQRRALKWMKRFGTWALLFSWTPLLGDLLCLAAGWLRLDLVKVSASVLVGKTLRYALVLYLAAL